MEHKPRNKGMRDKTEAEAAQDMKFGNAMMRDMERYSREAENPRKIDEDWKNHARFDGNRNLEARGDAEFGPEGSRSSDAAFINRMYMPYLGSGASPLHSNINPGRNSEFSTELDLSLAGRTKTNNEGNNNNKNKDQK